MIAGLDSSFDRPSPAQTAAAYAAGVRVWGGYIGTRGGLGLATLWSQADFDVVRNAGMTPIGFCSGWDDPVAVRDLARAWGALPCVDVERGIRDDGPWVQGWLDVSGAGLYGLASVHSGRNAAFHVISWYGAFPPACDDPRSVWPSWVPRPNAPLAWQFCGSHTEFGLSVDRGWYDDWFAGTHSGSQVGGPFMALTDQQQQDMWHQLLGSGADVTQPTLLDMVIRVYSTLNDGTWPQLGHPSSLERLEAAVAKLGNVSNLQPVLDAIAALKADLDGLTLKKV